MRLSGFAKMMATVGLLCIAALTVLYGQMGEPAVIASAAITEPNTKPVSSPLWTQEADQPMPKEPKRAASVQAQAQNLSLALEQIQRKTDKSDLQQALLQEHRQFKRYPTFNQAISHAQADPLSQRYAIDERTTWNDNHDLALTIWSDQKYYSQQKQAKLFVQLKNAQGQFMQNVISGKLLSPQGKVLQDLSFSQELGTRSRTVDLSGLDSGIYKVWISEQSGAVTDALTFTITQPGIRLSGEFRDLINEQGNLLIQTLVEVDKAANYYVQASLYSSTQVAIGNTQLNQALSPGKHWLDLEFSGLMIQDKQEAGPYVLAQLSLARVAMPLQRGPLLQPNYHTDSYGLDEFSPP